jgi:WD40 repeat protein
MRILPPLVGLLLAAATAPAADKVSYTKDVRPIFVQQCFGCHQPARPNGGYVMTDAASLRKPGESGDPVITPGKPDGSTLVTQVRVVDGRHEMPRDRAALKPTEIETITKWVAEGAVDDTPATQFAPPSAKNPPKYVGQPVVTSLAYSPDGKLLAVTGYHEILLHHADGSGLTARLIGLSERVQSLAFSPDGKFLAAAAGNPGRSGEVQVWDVAKRELVVSTPLTFDTLYGVSWSPDGKLLAVGGGDNSVRVLDARTGKQVVFMGTHSDWVLDTVFSRDAKHVVSVSRDMSMKLTDVASQRFIDNVTSITPGALKGGLMAVDLRPLKEQKMAKVSPDTPNAPPQVYDELVCAGADGVPRLYKMHREAKREIGDDANKIKAFDAMPGRVSAVRFSPDGTRFAAASSLDGTGQVRVYTVADGKFVVCEQVTGPAYAVAWSPDGKALSSAGFDGTVSTHDPATGKRLRAFPAAPPALTAARK